METSLQTPESIAHLAGFTLGHALWNVCDFEEEEDLLCPLAFTYDGSHLRLLRFEADSQEEAIERGLATLSNDKSLTSWAFAREGVLRKATGPTDVLLVDACAHNFPEPIVIAQPFRSAQAGHFALLGVPDVFISGRGSAHQSVISQLKAGILSHQKSAELWSSWQGW